MKVTDLNPDAKWAIAITLTNAWSNGNGPSFVYNNGYQCTKNAFGNYTPGYYNKKDQNDNIISYSFKTTGCTGCDPSKTEIPEWKLYLPEDSEFNKKKVMPSILPIIPLSSLVLDESPSVAVVKDTEILSPNSVR